MKRKYTIDTLVGKTCAHGSSDYRDGSREIIKAISPYTGKPINGFVNQEMWQIDFESGKFTILNDKAFQNLLKDGQAFYSVDGFFTRKVIEIFADLED